MIVRDQTKMTSISEIVERDEHEQFRAAHIFHSYAFLKTRLLSKSHHAMNDVEFSFDQRNQFQPVPASCDVVI